MGGVNEAGSVHVTGTCTGPGTLLVPPLASASFLPAPPSQCLVNSATGHRYTSYVRASSVQPSFRVRRLYWVFAGRVRPMSCCVIGYAKAG